MSIKIVEGGHCPDTKYEGEMQEKEAQQRTVKVCATTLKAISNSTSIYRLVQMVGWFVYKSPAGVSAPT